MGVMYGWDEHGYYSSAKAGVVGLVRGLANELERWNKGQWRASYIRTAQLLSEGIHLERKVLKRQVLLFLWVTLGPDDIADVIVFLLHEARYLTGK